MSAAQSKTLVDLRIDPQLGARPRPHARVKREIPGLTPVVRRKAVQAAIGRAKRRNILADIGGLPMKGPGVGLGSRRQAESFRLGVIVPIVQPESQAVQGEVGIEALRGCRKRHAMRSEPGEQIFELCRPIRRDRELDAGARCEAGTHLAGGFDRAWSGEATDWRASELGAGELIVAPSKAPRCVQQPMGRGRGVAQARS